MVEAVTCVASAASSCSKSEVMLQDVVTASDFGAIQSDLARDMARRAIARAIEAPVPSGPVAPRHEELTASSGNPVAVLKGQLLSGIVRPGAEPVAPDANGTNVPEDPMAQVAERIKLLYIELTEYQVAWKVGHKVQQDISHILRGQ
jgi:hypothetical protein